MSKVKMECMHCRRVIGEEKYYDHVRNCDPDRIPVSCPLDDLPEKKQAIVKTGVSCKMSKCSGEILSDTKLIEDYPPEFQIRGPGGRGQRHFETNYYCNTCGVSYQFLPEAE